MSVSQLDLHIFNQDSIKTTQKQWELFVIVSNMHNTTLTKSLIHTMICCDINYKHVLISRNN